MQDSVFVRLQLLPLFQGISKEELLRMLERAKFNFVTVDAGEVVVKQGTEATQLVYMLSGNYRVTREYSANFAVEEHLKAPMLFQPECLFGHQAVWTHTLVATTESQLLYISKQDLILHLMDFLTFRIALLNYLSHAIEASPIVHLEAVPTSVLTSRIIAFFKRYTLVHTGEKVYSLKMQYLATHLSTSRLSISKSLNFLQENGVLKLGRQKIIVDDFQKVIDFG